MQKGFLTLSKRSESKGFAGIIVLVAVLILAGLGGAYYFGKTQNPKSNSQSQITSLTPTPAVSDETVYTEQSRSANWKTYISEYGFSFRYPTDWSELAEENGVFVGEDNKSAFSPTRMLIISDQDNANDLAVIDFLKNAELRAREEDMKITEPHRQFPYIDWSNLKQENLANGLQVYYLNNELCEPYSCDIYYIPHGKRILTLIFVKNLGNIEEFETTKNKILSTFKFLP